MIDNKLSVELLQHSALNITAGAARTCWSSQDKSDSNVMAICDCCSTAYQQDEHQTLECPDCECEDFTFEMVCGTKDKELIDRIGNKYKHASILEHQTYTFFFKGISRALLQEQSRHRMASPSVKSTRYTLKELRAEDSFEKPYTTWTEEIVEGKPKQVKHFDIESARERAGKYLVFTGNDDVDRYSIYALENLRKLVQLNISNDLAKYALPESYKVELTWSVNARGLQNFLKLRSDKAALWEIRQVAWALFNALPDDHKYLFEHCMFVDKDGKEDKK